MAARASTTPWVAVVGVACGLVATVWAGIQIRDWYYKPRARVAASVTYGPIVRPPDEDRIFEALRTIDSEDFLSDAKVPPYSEQRIREVTRAALKMTYIDQIRGYAHFTLNNDGSEAAHQVRLTVPEAAVLSYVPRVGAHAQQIDGRTLEIPVLPALESVEVFAFLNVVPSRSEIDKIRLTHSSGLGKISVAEPDRRPINLGYVTLAFMVGGLVGGSLVLFLIRFRRESLLKKGRAEVTLAAERGP